MMRGQHAAWMFAVGLAATLLACGGMAPQDATATPAAPPPAGSESFTAAGVSFTVPTGWSHRTPSSSMRLAEYGLPGAGGEAELSVFAFGAGMGGDAQANATRWISQFKAADGGAPESHTQKLEVNGLSITIVAATGTYTPTSMGPMAPKAEPKSDQALYGVIVEGGPEGTVFVKVAGPRSTLAEQQRNLAALTGSARAGK